MVLEISNNLFERFNEVDEVDDGLMSERNSHPGHCNKEKCKNKRKKPQKLPK